MLNVLLTLNNEALYEQKTVNPLEQCSQSLRADSEIS